MKKGIVTVTAIVATVATMWFAQPVAPDHYELHHVTYGETMTSIIDDANKNTEVKSDLREARSEAVADSAKMDGGATSRSIKVGDKVAVPIYR